MSEEIKPKKERRFLKTLGKVGEILLQEVLLKLGSSLIRKIGGKKTLPSILFIFLSLYLFAQYPATGNKQRLGFQTTGDGLTWRGSLSDTATIQPINNQNAWVILDTVNLKIYSFDFTSNTWNALPQGTNIDTTSLSNRINLKLNISDTACMLTNYLRSGVADSTYLPLTGGTTSGLITSSFTNTTNYSTSATDNNAFTIYNNTTSSNNIYGGLQFLIGANSGAIPGGPGLAQIYAIRAGGVSDASTDLSFSTKGAGGVLEKMRIKFDGKVGIGTSTPSYLLDVNGQIGSTGFFKSGGLSTEFLKANGTVDNNTYLTTSSAASTYLPLTGGTVSGTINRQEGSHDGSASTFYYNILDYFAKQDNIKYNPTAQITFTDRPGTSTFQNVVRTSDIHLMTAKSFNGTLLGQYLDTTLSVVANQDGGRIGISKLNPAYKLDVNGTFNASGNSLIGGTLGVIGAISSESILLPYNKSSGFSQLSIFQNNNSFVISGGTGGIQFNNNTNSDALVKIFNNGNFKISNNQTDNGYKFEVDGTTGLQGNLTVNSSAVFNEASTDSDFRVESDGNANMVFVDASTDRVGIGTNTPTKTLDVNGEVRINTVTATPTSLLGKDGSNVVGEVTDINQSGVMKVGGITATTNSVGGINVAHGLSYTPSKVIATIAQLNSYVIVLRGITSSNLEFTIYDSTTGVGLNSVSVGFYWIAFK